MAKKRTSKAGKKTVKRAPKKKGGVRRSAAQTAAAKKARSANGLRRAKLHAAAALLKDFHGGKSPIKSGCGRPRGS